MSNLVVSNISDGTTSVGTGYVVNGSAKAWGECNGDATLSDSFNITSVTDHGTGDYSYTLTNAFTNDNFSQPSTVRVNSPSARFIATTPSRRTASTLAAFTLNSTPTAVDVGHNISAFGDLA